MNLLKTIINFGVSKEHDMYDVRLIRAINILSLNATVCLLFASFYGYFIQKNPAGYLTLFAIPLYLLTFYFNKINKMYSAITILFVTSGLTLAFFSIRTGEDANTHILFVLDIIGLALLYRKNQARNYYIINLIITLILIIVVVIIFKNNWLITWKDSFINPREQRLINFGYLVGCCILFSLVVVLSYRAQYKAMELSLNEQKVLLAEVNHRVKNNLAIIVSLLNMQKNSSSAKETKNALQDVHDRIMSMALVHEKMYQSKSKNEIEIGPYIQELIAEIKNSLATKKEITIDLMIDSIQLSISETIPLGLILNELVTNAFKHAFNETQHPKMEIRFHKTTNGMIEMIVSDNGSGISNETAMKSNGIGMDLITALTDQIDGTSSFENKEGYIFRLQFPIKVNH